MTWHRHCQMSSWNPDIPCLLYLLSLGFATFNFLKTTHATWTRHSQWAEFAFRDHPFPIQVLTNWLFRAWPAQEQFMEMTSNSLIYSPPVFENILNSKLAYLSFPVPVPFIIHESPKIPNSNSIASLCYLECNSSRTKGLNHVAQAGVCLHLSHQERI